MMIQNYYRLCHIQKLLTLCIAWLVCIHDNNYRVVIHKIHCLISVNKHRWLIIRIIHIPCH